MPYKVGQDIGGLGRLMEQQRWQVGQERLDRQEARNAKLSDLQYEAALQNIEEVKRGKSFQAGLAKAGAGAEGVVGKANARADFIASQRETNPDLAEEAHKKWLERGETLTDGLVDKGMFEEAAHLDNAILGNWMRTHGGQPNFKITHTPEDNMRSGS